jgi:hypothetical protein
MDVRLRIRGNLARPIDLPHLIEFIGRTNLTQTDNRSRWAFRTVKNGGRIVQAAGIVGFIAAILWAFFVADGSGKYARLYFINGPLLIAAFCCAPLFFLARALMGKREAGKPFEIALIRYEKDWYQQKLRARLGFYIGLFVGALMFALLGWTFGGGITYLIVSTL